MLKAIFDEVVTNTTSYNFLNSVDNSGSIQVEVEMPGLSEPAEVGFRQGCGPAENTKSSLSEAVLIPCSQVI